MEDTAVQLAKLRRELKELQEDYHNNLTKLKAQVGVVEQEMESGGDVENPMDIIESLKSFFRYDFHGNIIEKVGFLPFFLSLFFYFCFHFCFHFSLVCSYSFHWLFWAFLFSTSSCSLKSYCQQMIPLQNPL